MRMAGRFLQVLLAVAVVLCLLPAPARAAFSDVPSGAWYAEDVEMVQRYGVINGVGNGRFAPNRELTMAQAVAMACRAYAIWYRVPVSAAGPGEAWYETYIRFAEDQGILWQEEFGTDWDAPCTRLDMAILFYRVFPTETVRQRNQIAFLPDLERDEDTEGVFFLYEQGVLTGGDRQGTFYPYQNVTRAETAVILNRVLDPDRRRTFTFQPARLPASVRGETQEEAAMSAGVYWALLFYLRENGVQALPVRDEAMDQAALLLQRGGARSARQALRGVGYRYPTEDVQVNSYTTRTYCIQTGQTGKFSTAEEAVRSLGDIPHALFHISPDWGETAPAVSFDRVGVSVRKTGDGYQAVFVTASARGKNVVDGMEQIYRTTGCRLKVETHGLRAYGQTKDVTRQAADYLRRIPPALLRAFDRGGFRLVLTDGEGYDAQRPAGSITDSAGMTAYGVDNRVVIQFCALDRARTLYHEFGHVFHDLWLSNDILSRLYAVERDRIMTLTGGVYAGTNAKECFAEAFRMYMLKGEEASKTAPNYCRVIKTYIEYYAKK